MVGGSVSAAARPETDSTNRLQNPGVDKGSKMPSGWTRGQPVAGVEYVYDRSGGVEGSRALSLRKTIERYFPIAEWRQEFDPLEEGRNGGSTRLHVGALVKASKAYKAVIDVQFVGEAGSTHAWASYIGAKEGGDAPADHDWKWYSGVVEVPAGVEKIRVGLQIYGPGEVWFDQVLARYVDDDVAVTDATKVRALPAEQYGEMPPKSADDAAGDDASSVDGESWSRPCDDLRVGGDERKRYFLTGLPEGSKGRCGLLVVVPGGDGSADFQAFVRRIAEHAVGEDVMVAQAVAPVWRDDENRIVWPTSTNPDPKMAFSADDFLLEIIEDASRIASDRGNRVDPKRVYTLGWSSGGPPCYALSLRKKSPVRGTFVAMSVFQPATLPELKRAKGHAYYLLHSPEDFIAMSHPETAQRELKERRAKTRLQTYEGGHGWHGDVYGHIRKGLAWLEDPK